MFINATILENMNLWSRFLVSLACAGISLWAQDYQPPASTAIPSPPPPPPVLTNSGKPIVLPFECTREDVQSAGFSCSEEAPCPIYLELSAAASAGNKYYVAGNIHSDAVTLYSVLLGSEDAGRTWSEINPRIRAAGLDHLQFLDSQTGWAGGQQLFPLPQDPFVLLTTDGGKSWRQQSVFGDNSDIHFGSIQEFYFASKTDGSIIIDRSQGGEAGPFARYESSDGGETWTVKEQNAKLLRLKDAPAPDANWRLRVDAATKAFLVERRQGERWTSQAAFAVNLGTCKLPPQ
jgi:hypothetical protein